MKTFIFKQTKGLAFVAGMVAVLFLSNLTVSANPTKSLFGGSTTVALGQEFTGAVATLGLSVRTILPGRTIRRTRVSFPVTAGNLDFQNARGEIIHSGGLQISNATTTVKLTNFIIDTTGPSPVLTGMVQANGDLVGRIPLFNLELPALTLPLPQDLFHLRIPGVGVRLSADAAGALNAVFGVNAFVEGFPIGTADVSTLAFGQ